MTAISMNVLLAVCVVIVTAPSGLARKCNATHVAQVKPLERTIVGSCTIEVGTCPDDPCTCDKSPGYICPKTETQVVECLQPYGVHNVEIVTDCVCCRDEGIVLEGIVLALETGDPLIGMKISFGGVYDSDTDPLGQFAKTVVSTLSEVVILAHDDTGKYLDAVKVKDLPPGFRGPINIEMKMVKRSCSMAVLSTEECSMPMFTNPDNPGASVAEMVIEQNSMMDINNNIYTGLMFVSVTFADASPSGRGDDVLQGRFLTNGGDQLLSNGMFSIGIKDNMGNQLSGPVKFKVREGMKLWNLDTATGKWEMATYVAGRKKRNIELTDELIIEIDDNNWINIDQLDTVPACYFKARVIYQNPSDAANSPSFQPEIVTYTPNNERLQIYAPFTTTPDDVCFEARCLPYDPTEPTNVLFGFVNFTSYENVLVGVTTIPVIMQLEPKALPVYNPVIQMKHADVNYAVASNQKDIFVNFISSAYGTFYDDLATCEGSVMADPAFHFFKPELPAIVPAPDGTQFCTARIHFVEGGMFYDSLNTLTDLPKVVVTSTWLEGVVVSYATNITKMEFSNGGGPAFYFICVQYRCSTPTAPTTVYVDIDIPLVEVVDPMTGADTLWPLFQCEGSCQSGGPTGGDPDLCNNVGGVEGSFIAEFDISGYGPDYYKGTGVNDCDAKTKSDEFAYQLFCWKKLQ